MRTLFKLSSYAGKFNNKKVYVLKRSIRVEPAYYDLLPTNITELEELNYKMKLQLEDNYIDYSHLNQVMGGTLVLRRLNK